MDGDNRTLWDPKVTPASLELDFGKEITVEAIGAMGYGDTTHDIKAFTLATRMPAAAPCDPVLPLPERKISTLWGNIWDFTVG